MTNQVVVLFGLSGVGKTTFLKSVLKVHDFLHLQASELIRNQIEIEKKMQLSSEQLRLRNIGDNQSKLATAFKNCTNNHTGSIVLDGHSVIDTNDVIIKISPDEIAPLNPTSIVFLKETAETIYERRLSDRYRNRPTRTVEQLVQHQKLALEQANIIAHDLEIPIQVIGSNELDRFIEVL